MRHRARIRLLATAVAAALPVLAYTTTSASASPATSEAAHSVRVCAAPTRGYAACHAWVRTDSTAARVAPNATPSGYGPSDLQSAYSLPSATAGSGQTVAIVDAYNDPTAEADLGVYRAQFGLPACTTANGCFKKVNQTGGTKYPKTNSGWAQEISLDLDMVSAVCPNCHIDLVEAGSASFTNLGTAVNEAASLSPSSISNSYGGSDISDASAPYYNHPGIAVTASSGDSGYGVQFPASSHYVTAVGGTSLTRSGSTWSQTAWSGAGSGCSAQNTALSGQAGANTGCALRAVADVSAVADPNTGVAVYDSTPSQGQSGWLVFGGTSVASPIIASVYALAGNTASIDNNYPYTHSSALTDITSGSNGTCPTSQWCNAGPGWDGPTGLGTPNGTGAF
ncbi:MAG TPA: S53 family peptidase [Actinocrinis sp.]|uniref:S53 family peptidase n=1 Tax=Actinocrinis sp. TaxID=1920516 RepID=UPI002DDCB102|nr:S53 family peptidase [Actinocrinis sp.]HEV2347540.1 S53 family peptidase [Actinocrinis sp.]